MRKLILIKHARPQVDPTISSENWQLSEEGKQACQPLAEALKAFEFSTIYSSSEAKAVGTAEILSQVLNKPTETANDLFEHDRSSVPHMQTRDFISLIALFFKEPDDLVLGDETADEAYERFSAAVDELIAKESGDVAIVSHGTVIALFAQRRAKVEPFGLWRRMSLPSFLVLEIPSWRVIDERDKL